ncbi:MAG: alpha/beta fold hydrolase [Saprospiraceae bacterium]|nr:alpha/beta fold hydrolase [Saprospiraceae bacterium]
MKFSIVYILVLGFLLFGCKSEEKSTEIKSGFVNINGNQLYYNIYGVGDTIVVLHGGPGFSHKYLKPQFDSLLSTQFTLFYFDQRGSGWSDGQDDTLNLKIENFVEDLDLIRKRFKISKLNLLGHSFGGLLGMYYSVKYPKNVSSLILVDPDAASFELRTPYQIETINSRLTVEQNLYLDSLENTDNFKNYDPAIYTKYYKSYLTTYFANPLDTSKLKLGFDSISVPKINRTNSIVRMNLGEYDIHNQISAINCRTLILQGTESVFSVEGAIAIQNKIPKSEVHLIENCGHFEYIESPKTFKNLILEFYDKN